MADSLPWPLLIYIAGARQRDIQGLSVATAPDMVGAWLDFDIGDRIDRINALPEHPVEPVRLEIEGYSELLRPRGWTVELNAEPYDPWEIGVLAPTTAAGGGDHLGRLSGDLLAATRSALTSTGLSIAFDPNVYRWTTDSDDFPMEVRFGGETATVASIATTAATFVAAGSMSSADNAAVTPALYAGAAADDWIFVLARIRAASAGTIATPTGYTRIIFPSVSASGEMQLFVKVHSGSESAPTITPSGGAAGDTVSAVTFGFRNMPLSLEDLNDAVVYAATLTNASAQNVAYPPNTVRKDNAPIDGCVVLLLAGKDNAWSSKATVSGFTEAVDSANAVGNGQSLGADYSIQTAATRIDEGSFVVTGGSSAVSNGYAIAFAAGFQTMTLSDRSTNDVVKAHDAGTLIEVDDPLVLGL